MTGGDRVIERYEKITEEIVQKREETVTGEERRRVRNVTDRLRERRRRERQEETDRGRDRQ